MDELIKIETTGNIQTVNARDLHKFLENKRRFADWIKQRIEQYEFIENKDYILISQNCETRSGGTVRKEYYISINMAKELAMVENNEKGREARKYFISCETKLNQINNSIQKTEREIKDTRNMYTLTLLNHGINAPHQFIQLTTQPKKKLGIDKPKKEMTLKEKMIIKVYEDIAVINILENHPDGYYDIKPICLESCNQVNQILLKDQKQIGA